MKKNHKPFVKSIDVFSDDRGVFVPFLRIEKLIEEIGEFTIKRVYYVANYGVGITRGFHYHEKEWKIFFAVSGAAKIVAINPKNSKEQYVFVSSSRKPNLVVIPPFFAHGWGSLEESTILICCSNATLEESIKDDTRIDPYKWGDVWQVKAR